MGVILGENKGKIQPSLRSLWPIFFSYSIIALTVAAYILNMINFSNMMWPGEPFHAFEMGLILSMRMWSIAISGMVIGELADRFSRRTLLVCVVGLMGIAYLFNGFAPEGAGTVSWIYFTTCNSIAGLGKGGLRPILLSYTNDYLEKDNRSSFFGIFHSIAQIFLVVGMVFSSLLIQTGFWRVYYWSIGILVLLSTFVIMLKIKEPKRATQSVEEMTIILGEKNIKYEYQLTKDTIKSTVLKPTNIVALIEGIFTCILLGTLHFLLLSYMQTPPINVSSISTSLFVLIFGIPGALIGSIGLAKKSDKWGRKNINIRLNVIVFSILWVAFAQIVPFLIPFSGLTKEEGNNIFILLALSQFWIMGFIWTSISAVRALYQINQPPILQAINLPEAQGKVSSWNQFLETVGQGVGPLIAGLILSVSEQNYILASLIISLIGVPGAILWLFAKRRISGDINNIKSILTERAEELKKRSYK